MIGAPTPPPDDPSPCSRTLEPSTTPIDEPSTLLHEVLVSFRRAWQQGPPPDLDTFLSPTVPDRRLLLAGLVRIDLGQRLQKAPPARVEDSCKVKGRVVRSGSGGQAVPPILLTERTRSF